jgi:hypothetical protein
MRMMTSRTVGQVESDLIALRAAAERAGMALACLFSSSDEFEAANIEARRAQLNAGVQISRLLRSAMLTGLLAGLFLML